MKLFIYFPSFVLYNPRVLYFIPRAIICVMLCVSLSGCDALYRLLHKEGAEEKELVGEVVPFERNPTIEEIQILLKMYGYNPGNIDGVLGGRTRDAIAKFQKDNNLKETRFVDKETWVKLRIFKDNNLIQEDQLNIKLIQAVLKKAGCNPGEVDGKFGAKTAEAIKKFQKENELKVDGKVGYQTLTKLAEFLD